MARVELTLPAKRDLAMITRDLADKVGWEHAEAFVHSLTDKIETARALAGTLSGRAGARAKRSPVRSAP